MKTPKRRNGSETSIFRRFGVSAFRRFPFGVSAFGVSAFLIIAAGCSRTDDQVVVYVSADDYVAREVIAAFEEETGIRVRMVGDTEAKKTTGLVERLRSERNHPIADVFWSSEIFLTIELADEGVLVPFTSPALADWPDQHRDGERRWYAFAARARVIVYAPDRATEDEIPEAWTQLSQDPYRGRIAMADPRFGTTGGHLGAMKAYWDRTAMPGYFEAWAIGVAENRVRLLPSGNAGVVQAVIDGEADFGFTDTDDVWAAKANGRNVAMVYPRHNRLKEQGDGTLLIPNTVGLVDGAPHPKLAGRFIDFLLSERVERILAESDSRNIPLRPGLAAEYPELEVPDPLLINFREAARERNEAIIVILDAIRHEKASRQEGSRHRGEEGKGKGQKVERSKGQHEGSDQF